MAGPWVKVQKCLGLILKSIPQKRLLPTFNFNSSPFQTKSWLKVNHKTLVNARNIFKKTQPSHMVYFICLIPEPHTVKTLLCGVYQGRHLIFLIRKVPEHVPPAVNNKDGHHIPPSTHRAYHAVIR